MIPDLYRAGMSANKIIREARGMGISYRRQTMLADIRELTGRMTKQYFVERFDPRRIITKGIMTEVELPRAKKYYVIANALYKDLVTGEQFEKNVSFYTNEAKTFEMYEEDYVDWKEEAMYRVDLSFISFKPLCVEHNAGWDY